MLRRVLLFFPHCIYKQQYTAQNLPGKHRRFSGFLEIQPLGCLPQTCSTTPVSMIAVCLRLSCYYCHWSTQPLFVFFSHNYFRLLIKFEFLNTSEFIQQASVNKPCAVGFICIVIQASIENRSHFFFLQKHIKYL